MHFIWPWQDRSRRFSWLKASAFLLVLAPGLRMICQLAAGDYGILPMAYGGLVYWSGVWATAVLLMALAVTPAMRILRWPALIDVRRMIGVAALAYTVVHIIVYFGLRSWRFGFIANETITRLTLIVATLSTVGLIVLGATSFDAAIKSMGARNWQRLHYTNYLISGLAILHIVLARGTYPEQYLLTALFVWLMAWRVLDSYRRGTDAVALALLAVAACLLTALLEAGHFWLIRGYEPSWTLANNFNPVMWEINIPPAWKALVFGLAFVLMNKDFGVAALVLAIVGIFVPVCGLWVSGIACFLAVVSALEGDRIFAIATPLIVGVNTFVLSPAVPYLLSNDASGHVLILLFLAAPFAAVALNALGTFRIGDAVARGTAMSPDPKAGV